MRRKTKVAKAHEWHPIDHGKVSLTVRDENDIPLGEVLARPAGHSGGGRWMPVDQAAADELEKESLIPQHPNWNQSK